MKLLLDTHVLLWWLADDPRLGTQARELVAEPTHTVFVSAATIWEITIKESLQKLTLPSHWVEAVAATGFAELPMSSAHARATASLPRHHRDPFDRMLVAQARAEKMTLMSADVDIGKYDVSLIKP